MIDLEKVRQRAEKEGFALHNGVTLTALEEGYCQCRAEMTEASLNPHGIAHGGLLFTLCDTAAGLAATATGRTVVTQSADIHFLRPGLGPVLIASARVVKKGHQTALCTAEVRDEQGQLLTTATFEMFFFGKLEG